MFELPVATLFLLMRQWEKANGKKTIDLSEIELIDNGQI